MDGTSNRTGKSTEKENSNGRSETNKGGRRNRSVDAAESAFCQGGQLLFEQPGDNRK